MKQGRANTVVAGTKIEPKSRGINPAAVSEIGIHQVRTRSVQVYEGRGLEAPMKGCTTHTKGSQGKH